MSDTFDSSLENIFPDDPGTHDFIAGDLASQWKSSSGDGYVSTGGEGYNLEQVTASPQTLRDHVAEQIIFRLCKRRATALSPQNLPIISMRWDTCALT